MQQPVIDCGFCATDNDNINIRLPNISLDLYYWRMPVKPLIILLSGLLLQFAVHAGQQPPRIAAASSLQYGVPDSVAAFQRRTGQNIRVTYGSSGNFRRQIGAVSGGLRHVIAYR